MNELKERRILNFESKTYVMKMLAEMLHILHNTTKQTIKKLHQGITNDEIIKAFLHINLEVEEVGKCLDVEVTTKDKVTGQKNKVFIKVLDYNLINSIRNDIEKFIKIAATEKFNQKKFNAYIKKILNGLLTLQEEYRKAFEEYKKEALELKYISQKDVEEVNWRL